MKHSQDLVDPRIERSKRHQLLDIIASAICGADSRVYVEMFGKSKEGWFHEGTAARQQTEGFTRA